MSGESAESVIALANQVVPMFRAAALAGVSVSGSAKTWCPFGEFSHSDGGREKSFRVYPDHAYCFACKEWYSPVRLCAELWDVGPEQAAARLLEVTGYKPASLAHLWGEVTRPPAPDLTALGQALRNYCQGECPDWETARMEPQVAEYLARCLGLLSVVGGESAAEVWLAKAKLVMGEVLRRRHAEVG